MAAQIKIKRSNISNKLPVVGDLELGELAINTFDGKLFLKKNNGTESIVEIGTSTNTIIGAAPILDKFSGNGSTTSFTLSVNPASKSTVQVYIGGVYQNSAAFTLLGSTLTFAAAPPAGTQNIEIRTVAAYVVDTLSASVSMPSGTASSVPYLNASKTLVSGSTLTFNGTDLTVSGQVVSNSIAPTTPVAVAYGGTGTTTPSLVAGTNITVTGTWPNQTISSSGGGGVSGTIAITNGGTGATTAADALINLGAYAATNPSGYITSSALSSYQPLLVSGTNIKTINGTSLVGSGDIVISGSSSTIGVTPILDKFSGNGSTTVFTLSVTPANISGVQVYIGGVYQNSAAFTLSGATLTFAAAPPAGTQNIEIRSVTAYVISEVPNLDASKITSGTINAARLPSYVDDVLEAANLASFPATGETGKIYIDLATNKTYRWSGSVYVSFNSGAVDSVAGKTGIVTLTSTDVGLSSVENKNSATIRSEITSANVTTALGFTPLSGIVPIANGGTGTTTPSLAAGADIAISGTWPNQTISSTVDHLSPFLFLG